MKSEASHFHSNIVEEFRQGIWYEPRDSVGQDRPINSLLLSAYGAMLFAAVTVAVAGIGGNTFLMSAFVAVLCAATTVALVGIADAD